MDASLRSDGKKPILLLLSSRVPPVPTHEPPLSAPRINLQRRQVVQAIADRLTSLAARRSTNPRASTPWAIERHQRTGNPLTKLWSKPLGGKTDDITTVVVGVS